MNTLVIDTETTGLLQWGLPLSSDAQPWPTEIAAALLDQNLAEIDAGSLLVRPDGWKTTKEAAKCSGLSQERLEQSGKPLREVLSWVDRLAERADRIVAFNADFDRRILISAQVRYGVIASYNAGLPWFCVMLSLTDEMRLPGGHHGDWKYPKLAEAYLYCTGKGMAKAHSALADVRATAECLRFMRDHKIKPTAL